MSEGIEFTSEVGLAFTAYVIKSIEYATLESGTSVTEVTPGRYRIVTNRTGVVWVEATAGATKAYGWANLDRPAENGFAEVRDSLGDAAGVSITVLPLNAAVQDRVDGTAINLFFGEVVAVSIVIRNANGTAIEDLDERTLQVVIEGRTRADRVVIADEAIERVNGTVTFTPPASVVSTIGSKRWSLRDVTSGQGEGTVLAHGRLNVNYAPAADA